MYLPDMMKLCERVYEFRDYMRMFYNPAYDGVYGELNFTDDEIIEGINEYIKNEQAKKDIMKYGADTVDREAVRDIILMMRGEA
jgi:hypothetical protein